MTDFDASLDADYPEDSDLHPTEVFHPVDTPLANTSTHNAISSSFSSSHLPEAFHPVDPPPSDFMSEPCVDLFIDASSDLDSEERFTFYDSLASFRDR